MKKHEAKISRIMAKWFLNVCYESAPFEIKHTKFKDRFNLKEISDQQLHSLEACTTEHGFIWKIPDANMGYLPFDYIMYKNSPAYVIIVYPHVVTAIHIKDILKIKTPSLHFSRAIQLSHFKVKLKDL